MARRSSGKVHSIAPLVIFVVMLVSLVSSLEAQLMKGRSKFMNQVGGSAKETTRVASKFLPQAGHNVGGPNPFDACHLRGLTRQQSSFHFHPGRRDLPWKELLTPDQVRGIPGLRRIPGTPPQRYFKIEPGEPGDPPITVSSSFGPVPPL